jgi:hypothetical protein
MQSKVTDPAIYYYSDKEIFKRKIITTKNRSSKFWYLIKNSFLFIRKKLIVVVSALLAELGGHPGVL